MDKNTLIIVGSGIKFMSHLTTEVKACIEKSDKVLYLVNEPAMQEWIQKSNKCTESLDFLYTKYEHREDNYRLISDYILESVQQYKTLCFVVYGHPTVFVQPSIYAATKAKERGFNVITLPGISAEDCLFADLLVDPGSCGCQSFEATDFLLYRREYDSSCHLILWQVSVIGVLNTPVYHDPMDGFVLLVDYLLEKYFLDHEIIVYEAAQYPTFKPKIERILLKDLPSSKVSRIATLYIPPNHEKQPDLNMLQKLKKINKTI